MNLSFNGLKLATASQKGTLIRIFNVENGQCIQELRRGSEPAQIMCVYISPCGNYLCCSSNTGTLHLFTLKLTQEEIQIRAKQEAEGQQQVPNMNHLSKLSILGPLVPYFSSQWSFASYKLKSNGLVLICFLESFTMAVITSEGKYYKFGFDPINGGEFIKLDEKNLK